MRKIIENQLKFGQVDISKIKIDIICRDEIPQLLTGLQALYADKESCNKVFKILERITPEGVDPKNGRPGMDLWKILVLGNLRLNCNWDYDKLHNIANNHMNVREFLGHTIYDFDQTYSLQSLKDNVGLLTPEVLDEISQITINLGHKIIQGNDKDVRLKGRCDSFVLETDVHFPTDVNLLFDAIRKTLSLTAKLCDDLGITEWRQYKHILKKIKKKFNFIRKLKHSSSKDKTKKALREKLIIEAHQEYTDLVETYVFRARQSIMTLNELGFAQMAHILMIEKYINDAIRQIEQIRRRAVNGETIAHHEKVFSIFEEHTEWICKGKAGIPQELGLGVCILEDQYGFILHHHVMEKQKDVDIAVLMVAEAKSKVPALTACSFDKGFYNPKNREQLGNYLDSVVLPKKGKLSEADKKIEYSEEFVEARRKHAAVESAINALENHGLDICPDHGITGFKRYVALAVLARNIQVLGATIRKKQLEKQKRRKAA